MRAIDIIEKKNKNEILEYDEIKYMVNSYVKGKINDKTMSDFLWLIYNNGLTIDETIALTDVMIKSGETIDLSSLGMPVVDKHSTGGVGDKVTLIVGPIVASCGVPVPKMSGRGLGHTGGTIDKLESIKGFNTNLTEEEFINQIKKIGFAVTGQTKNLCPLDKVIYALRDVTGTVASIPLIATSIMSKKIAGGADKILLDVKVGDGALMKTMEDAKALASIMERIGKAHHRDVICEITDMNVPLGHNIGNSLEVIEAMDTLQGRKGKLYDLCLDISANMISLSKGISYDEALSEATEALTSGRAFKKFEEFVKMQGGDLSSLEVSNQTIDIISNKKGTLKNIRALALGELSVSLGAGRRTKEDSIDHSVGIVIHKDIDDKINVGDKLATLYVKDKNLKLNPDDYFEIK